MAPASGDIFSVAVSTANPGNSGRPLDGMHCQRAGEEAGDSVICVRLLMREDVCAGSGAVNRGGRGVSAEYRYAQSQRRSFRRGGRVERRPQRGRFPPDPDMESGTRGFMVTGAEAFLERLADCT